MKRSKRDSGSGHGFLVAAAVALGIYIGHAMGGRMANQLMQTGIDTAVAAALQSATSSVVPALAIHATVAIACALVFDRKQTVKGVGRGSKNEIDGVERCRDFINASKKSDLETDCCTEW